MQLKKKILKSFTNRLLDWNRHKNRRVLPWKREPDPYRIWLSEIILQQTRVEQGTKYYLDFITRFPDIHALAQAPEDAVYKAWEGLGYYSRCRNLVETARLISSLKNGVFPNTYEELLSLKGVGPYTAAAIASFAFGLPHSVVDGNVLRILSRIFGCETPVDSQEGKRFFSRLAQELLDKSSPAEYNQAVMDFGATVCKPISPECNACFFTDSCYAFKQHKIHLLPVKSKKTIIRQRWFYYLVLVHEKEIAIRKRRSKDIWHNLFEYYLLETSSVNDTAFVMEQAKKQGILNAGCEIVHDSPVYLQQLTHQYISAKFIRIKVKQRPVHDLIWILDRDLSKFAFPKVINQYHGEHSFQPA